MRTCSPPLPTTTLADSRSDDSLQRFKLNIASTVVSQQNSDLDSLGTDQILDLFQVSDTPAAAAASNSSDDKPMSQKAILESLDDVAEDDYADLDVSSFTASLAQ